MYSTNQPYLVDTQITERISCYLIKAPSFAALCDTENPSRNGIINQSESLLAYISYDKIKLLGKGTFKTAHLASLQWISNAPSVGLGSNSSKHILVALKRPYDDRHSGAIIKRFNYVDESRKVLTEATMLGWADSLLQFAYDFIDDFILTTAVEEPLFEIPRLRFVKGAIAYSEKSLDSHAGGRSTSHRASYLLEELLLEDDLFIKYIHNADAVPLQDCNEPGYEIGIFLCFVQHVQFNITHGQAYISDFQGMYQNYGQDHVQLIKSIL